MDIDKLVARIMQRSKRSDGKLTKDDLPERLQGRFEKIDANSDGFIDASELREWLTKVKRRAEMLEKQLPAATTPTATTPAAATPAAAPPTATPPPNP